MISGSPLQRAQVGIGTLIVFIAMVLVAAIASGVLIQAAGLLQTQSEVTGQESIDQTTNRIQVFSLIGRLSSSYDINDNNVVVDNTGNVVTGAVVDSNDVQANVVTADGRNVIVGASNNVEAEDGENIVSTGKENIIARNDGEVVADGGTIKYSVELGAADNIITYGGDGSTQYNVETAGGVNVVADPDASFTGGAVATESEVNEIDLMIGKTPGAGNIRLDGVTIQYLGPEGATTLVKNDSVRTNTADIFNVTEIKSDSGSDHVLTQTGDRFQIEITLSESPNEALRPVKEGETVTLLITTRSGATTSVLVTIPDSLEGKSVISS